MKKETSVNFLIDPLDGRSTRRPVGVMMYEWVGGKHLCVDLTKVSRLMGLRVVTFTVGQAILKLKVTSNKVDKYEKSCSNQYIFIPFAFDTWFPSIKGC
jgi:hypothetical protein